VFSLTKAWRCYLVASQFSQKSKSGRNEHLYLIPTIGTTLHPSQVTPWWTGLGFYYGILQSLSSGNIFDSSSLTISLIFSYLCAFFASLSAGVMFFQWHLFSFSGCSLALVDSKVFYSNFSKYTSGSTTCSFFTSTSTIFVWSSSGFTSDGTSFASDLQGSTSCLSWS